jgi:DNA-directed RNA polymerase subunit RPC12/RpoP
LVPLEHLSREPQHIHCPKCKQNQKTMVKGRSKGMMTFMDIFWWPLPNRKHWFETVHWFCGNCNVEVAMKKSGKPIQVLVQE